MKHYYGYKTDGSLYWQLNHTGGYPDGCSIDDENCTHTLSVAIRAAVEKSAASQGITLGGIVEFSCPCTIEDCPEGICTCPTNKRNDAYYCTINNCLVDKPTTSVLVDGVVYVSGDSIVKVPTVPFTVKVTGAGIPDGSTAILSQASLHPTGQHTLTFTEGVTNEVTLTAPAQGITGNIGISGVLVCPTYLSIKAFA